MKYRLFNLVTNEEEFFETIEEAVAKNELIKQAYITQEAYRFTIAKELVNGNDTTWLNADLTNDPEDAIYQVFNHKTGVHEQFMSLSAAKQRIDALKQEFLNEVFIKAITEVDRIEIPALMPSTTFN